MTDLPTPKRYVVKPPTYQNPHIVLYTDSDVSTFVSLLAPILWVITVEVDKTYMVELDPRYAHDSDTKQETYTWLLEQLENEFGGSKIPNRPQNDVNR